MLTLSLWYTTHFNYICFAQNFFQIRQVISGTQKLRSLEQRIFFVSVEIFQFSILQVFQNESKSIHLGWAIQSAEDVIKVLLNNFRIKCSSRRINPFVKETACLGKLTCSSSLISSQLYNQKALNRGEFFSKTTWILFLEVENLQSDAEKLLSYCSPIHQQNKHCEANEVFNQ